MVPQGWAIELIPRESISQNITCHVTVVVDDAANKIRGLPTEINSENLGDCEN